MSNISEEFIKLIVRIRESYGLPSEHLNKRVRICHKRCPILEEVGRTK